MNSSNERRSRIKGTQSRTPEPPKVSNIHPKNHKAIEIGLIVFGVLLIIGVGVAIYFVAKPKTSSTTKGGHASSSKLPKITHSSPSHDVKKITHSSPSHDVKKITHSSPSHDVKKITHSSPHTQVHRMAARPHTQVHRMAARPHTQVHRMAARPHTQVRHMASRPHTQVHRMASRPHTQVHHMLLDPHIQVHSRLNRMASSRTVGVNPSTLTPLELMETVVTR